MSRGTGIAAAVCCSGKEALSPAPPPLRTARAGFLACRSSIGQRIREDTRWPHWPWGPPERYHGRAGYRDDFGGDWSTSKGRCGPADSCIPACAGWLTVHARRHPEEVSPLSGGVMLPPLSSPLPVGLRLLPRPLPAAPSVDLTASLPQQGRATGLPRSADRTEWVRSCLWAGGVKSACHGTLRLGTAPRTFWSQPISSLTGGRRPSVADSPWLVEHHGLCGTSPGLAIPLVPGS